VVVLMLLRQKDSLHLVELLVIILMGQLFIEHTSLLHQELLM
jgi:hypothetical protein